MTIAEPVDERTIAEPVDEGTKRPWTIPALRTTPNLGVFLGLGVILAGGGLLVLAWGRVAGLTDVALQTPYVVIAGCLGLAFVAIGLAIVSIAIKIIDGRARAAQMGELHDTLVAIRTALEERR